MPISLSGSLNLSGSLTTTGTITATTLVVQTITSSISSITGSTNFGSLSSDTHKFTGSMLITGSITQSGNNSTSSFSGKVGINNTVPSSQLHIVGSSGDIWSSGLKVTRENVPSQYAILNMVGGGYNFLATNSTTGEPVYTWLTSTDGTNYSTKMTLNAGSYMLDISGSGRFTGTLTAPATTFTGASAFSGNTITLSGANPSFTMSTSTTNLYSYIGFTAGTAESSIFQLGNTYATTGAYLAGALTITSGGVGGISLYASNAAGAIRFYTGGSSDDKLRLIASGYLKVSPYGTYVAANSNFHELHASANNSDLIYLSHNQASPYGIELAFTSASPNNTSNWFFYANDSTNAKAIIYSNGTFGSRTGTYGSIISDIKYKQDITDANSQWNDIKNLRVVNFRYKEDVQNEGDNALRQIGFIAQEVEQVSPGLVYEASKKDTDETWKSVKTSIIEIKAIKALQEAMAKIETLEARVQYLENK